MYSEPAGFSVSFNLDGILLVEAFQILDVLRWIVAAFGRHAASALTNLLDYGVGCRHDLLFTSQQFEWRDQVRNMKPEEGVYPTNMSEFVGVCEVLAVPREQVVELVEGGQGQVQGISERIVGHDLMFDIDLNSLRDLVLNGNRRKRERHSQGVRAPVSSSASTAVLVLIS